MKITHIILVAALTPLFVAAQADEQADAKRFAEIKAKFGQGQPISDAERQWAQHYQMTHRNQQGGAKKGAAQQGRTPQAGQLRGGAPAINPVDTRQGHEDPNFVQAHPPRDHTGFPPIADLGTKSYQGEQGGYYPGGLNAMPKAHLEAGLKLARTIEPLDASGHKSADGKIGFLAVGMSSVTMEFQAFLKMAESEKGLNPKLAFVDGAQNSLTAFKTQEPGANFWKVIDSRLDIVGVTPKQVQAVWYKQADANPTEGFAAAKKLQAETEKIMQILHNKFPNLKIVYLSNRTYGGYAGIAMNPEPYAYENSFAVKWAIGDQLAGKPELNYDPGKGEVHAPWMAWGPDLWTDGVKGRQKDGLIWNEEDCLVGDRTHPSMKGREKVAKMLMDFLKNDPTSKSWFVGKM
jgi:hypothetical protein